MDVDYFVDAMVNEDTKFLFEVVLTFELSDVMETSFDFAAFPYLKHVLDENLSDEQCETARRLGRKMQREKPKLVSSFEKIHVITDFTSNILYLLIFKKMKILSIKSRMIHQVST